MADAAAALARAEVLFVGGGNSFRLLKALHELDLITVVRQRVGAGESVLQRLEHADRLAVLDALLRVVDSGGDDVAGDAHQLARQQPAPAGDDRGPGAAVVTRHVGGSTSDAHGTELGVDAAERSARERVGRDEREMIADDGQDRPAGRWSEQHGVDRDAVCGDDAVAER